MLSPDVLQAVINDITSVYENVERTCIASISEALSHGKNVKSINAWRMKKLTDVGALRNQLLRRVTTESRRAYKEVEGIVMEALRLSTVADAKLFNALADTTEFTWAMVQQSDEFKRILNATMQSVTESLNYTGTRAVEASIESYRNAINTAYLEVLTGNSTTKDAVRKAVTELGGNGIKLTYGMSSTGRKVTCNLESAIRRDIVTTINQSGAKLTLANCQDLKCELVETTWHVGARPEHELWQGKVFSLDPNNKKYPYFYALQEDGGTGYGTIEGLCGINCRHSFFPYVEGTEQTAEFKDEFGNGKPSREENNRIYALEQKQNYYLRNIRSLNNQKTALLAGGFKDEANLVNERLRQWQRNYQEFLRQNRVKVVSLRQNGNSLYQPTSLSPNRSAKISELQTYAKEQLGVNADYSTFSNSNAEMVNDCIEKMQDKFPQLKKSAYIQKVENFIPTDNTFASYSADTGTLFIQGLIKKDDLIKKCNYEFEKHYWITNSPEAPIYHELGHALMYSSIRQNPNNGQQLVHYFKTYIAKNNNAIKNQQNTMSIYGLSSVYEFVAESIVDYMTSNKPLQSTIDVVKILMKK